MISRALANKDYESLEGLVAEDMIEVLKTKIETLSPEQRWLIAVREEDVVFQVLSDIATTATGKKIMKPLSFRDVHVSLICR